MPREPVTAPVNITVEAGLVGGVYTPTTGGAFVGSTLVYANGAGADGIGKVCLSRKWSATIAHPRSSLHVLWNGVIAQTPEVWGQCTVDNQPGKARGTVTQTLTQNQPDCLGTQSAAWAPGLRGNWKDTVIVTPVMSQLLSVSYQATVTVYDKMGTKLGTLPAVNTTTKATEGKFVGGVATGNYFATW